MHPVHIRQLAVQDRQYLGAIPAVLTLAVSTVILPYPVDFTLMQLQAGPAPCMLLACVLRGGKTMKNGKKGFLGSIRHADRLKDSHGALGRAFCWSYTLKKASCHYTCQL